MILAAQTLTWSDKIGLLVTVITSLGAAVAACLAAWRSGQVHSSIKIPSNGVNTGSVTENTNVALRYLIPLLYETMGKEAPVLPTVKQTEAMEPGATLNTTDHLANPSNAAITSSIATPTPTIVSTNIPEQGPTDGTPS